MFSSVRLLSFSCLGLELDDDCLGFPVVKQSRRRGLQFSSRKEEEYWRCSVIELNWKGSEEEEWASRNRTHPRSSFPTSLTVSPVHRLGVRPSFFLFIMFIYQLYMEGCCRRPALSPASIRESPRVFTPHRLILIILQKRTIFPPFSVQKSRGSFLSAEQSHLNLA